MIAREMIAEKAFAESVAKDIRNFLPEKYENAEFQVMQMNKRAKRRVILVGSKQAFSQAIRAGRSKKRNTLLSYRLKKAFAEFLDKNEAA